MKRKCRVWAGVADDGLQTCLQLVYKSGFLLKLSTYEEKVCEEYFVMPFVQIIFDKLLIVFIPILKYWKYDYTFEKNISKLILPNLKISNQY